MLANIPRLQAARTRRELTFRPDIKLKAMGVYDLVKAETEDEETAQEAVNLYLMNLHRAGEPVE